MIWVDMDSAALSGACKMARPQSRCNLSLVRAPNVRRHGRTKPASSIPAETVVIGGIRWAWPRHSPRRSGYGASIGSWLLPRNFRQRAFTPGLN